MLTYEKYLDTFIAIFIVPKQFAIVSNHAVVTINTITVKLSLEEEFLENVNGNKINTRELIWKNISLTNTEMRNMISYEINLNLL